MPRPGRILCPLSDLAAALVGAAGGGQATAVVGVCEFSCSCCRSSTSLAADALCTYLTTGSGAVQEFCGRAGGLQALQVGLSSSNPAVVCAAIRVAGAVLQALLLQHQHNCTADSTNIRPSTQRDQQEHHKELVDQLATNQSPGFVQQTSLTQQEVQQQCSAAPDWLDEGSSLIALQPPASAVIMPAEAAAAATPCTAPQPGRSSGSTGSATAVSGGAGAAAVMSAPAAAAAADLLATLTAHARGEARSSTTNSTSSGINIGDGSAAAAVGVRVSALLELQQLMLRLADAAATTAAQHSQKLLGPCTQHRYSASNSSWPFVCSTLEGSCQAPSSSTGIDNSNSSGVGVVLGPSWLQSVLVAAMEALNHADPSLRRAGSQALAAALVLQDGQCWAVSSTGSAGLIRMG